MIEYLQEKWEEEISEIPFDYDILDEHYEEMYQNEKQTRSLLNIFAAIAIFISCMGLFGLASFMAERRTKEIGIRKTNGATTRNISGLAVHRFYQVGIIGQPDCLAPDLVGHEKMVGKLCLQDRDSLLGLCGSRAHCFYYCPCHGKFPCHQGKQAKSGNVAQI